MDHSGCEWKTKESGAELLLLLRHYNTHNYVIMYTAHFNYIWTPLTMIKI